MQGQTVHVNINELGAGILCSASNCLTLCTNAVPASKENKATCFDPIGCTKTLKVPEGHVFHISDNAEDFLVV